MPKVKDIFSQLNGTKCFFTLDLLAGYHHIPLDETSIPKTAFISPFGKYRYIKVPFGLAQVWTYFQELMTRILKDFNFTISYLDSIIIFSRTAQEHLDHIKQVFEKLRSTYLSMKLRKCHLFTKEIQYLGYILSTKGITPLTSKTQAIKSMHPPKMPKQGYAFLGLVGYYRKFIRNFCKNSQAFDTFNPSSSKIQVDTNNTQGISHPSTNIALPKSRKMLHSLYRHIRWCLWGTVVSGTWWNRIHNSLPFTYLHWHKTEMEHHRTKGLWCILLSHEIELLPSGSWNHSMQLDVDFSYCWLNLVEVWYSLEQYIGLKEDKLSSTTFIQTWWSPQ